MAHGSKVSTNVRYKTNTRRDTSSVLSLDSPDSLETLFKETRVWSLAVFNSH